MIELFVKSLKFRFMNIGFFIIRILIVITAVSAVFMPAFFYYQSDYSSDRHHPVYSFSGSTQKT